MNGARTAPVRSGCSRRFAGRYSSIHKKFEAAAGGDHPRSVSLAKMLVGLIGLAAAGDLPAAEPAPAIPAGRLSATFTAAEGKATDTAVLPNVWLYVPAGQPPTPFLPGGKFTAVWNGALASDLRSDWLFRAELNGTLKLEINGVVALEATGAGSASPLSQPVRLNKGANAIKATFTGPASGDAFVRLDWTEKGTNTYPIPLASLSHAATSELQRATQLRRGRALFLDHRCAKCHADKRTDASVPELNMDAPSFDGIGARRNFEWLARWILDPRAMRSTAHMPKLLRGDKAREDAGALASFLASLTTSAVDLRPVPTAIANGRPSIEKDPSRRVTELDAKSNDQAEQPAADGNGAAQGLFEQLHCGACHDALDAKEHDPAKLSLRHVAEKFPTGKLAAFLLQPERHYAWTRMPNFKLTVPEAKALAAVLLAASDRPKAVPEPADKAVIERGRRLVQTTGCLNCHALNVENQFKAPPLDVLYSRHLKKRSKIPAGDCLGATPLADYGFTLEERGALDAFTLQAFDSLSRHVPSEFAERESQGLKCRNCHGQFEGFPPVEILGGKLKPEWAAQFIAGEIAYKPRAESHPGGDAWLPARMPAFASRAKWLAAGLAMQHGYPPKTAAEEPVDMEAAKMGQQLVGKEGGFACVACHAVGSVKAVAVFESEGPNLAWSADRLLRPYYFRWLRDPQSIDPQTKMPMYFDEDKSPFVEIYEGRADQQINAIWQYLRLGDRMPAPKTE